MADNYNKLRRQSGMSREEFDYFMNTGNLPQGISFEEGMDLRARRDALNKEGYDESVADYEATDTGGYVAPEDQTAFEYTGYGNQPGATDIQDVGEYTAETQNVGGYVPPEDQQAFEYTGYGNQPGSGDIQDVGEYTAHSGMEEQGNMYMKGVTDNIRRGDYDSDEAFNEALVRARHAAGHPNPYNSAEGAQFYANLTDTHYVDPNIIGAVDPYGLFTQQKEKMENLGEMHSVFGSQSLDSLDTVTVGDNTYSFDAAHTGTPYSHHINPDGSVSTSITSPGQSTISANDPFVAPEDQEDEWVGHQPTGYGNFPGTPKEPMPFPGPPRQMPNPMERNPMEFNPMSDFGLLGPRSLNMPRALPTSDELN